MRRSGRSVTQKKKLDNLCIKEFGCKASEIVRTRELVKELMALYGKGPEDLAAYVEWTKEQVNRTKHDA